MNLVAQLCCTARDSQELDLLPDAQLSHGHAGGLLIPEVRMHLPIIKVICSTSALFPAAKWRKWSQNPSLSPIGSAIPARRCLPRLALKGKNASARRKSRSWDAAPSAPPSALCLREQAW